MQNASRLFFKHLRHDFLLGRSDPQLSQTVLYLAHYLEEANEIQPPTADRGLDALTISQTSVKNCLVMAANGAPYDGTGRNLV